MYIRRKVFSLLQDENGEERYFSTTEFTREDAEEKTYAKKDDEESTGKKVAKGAGIAAGATVAAAGSYQLGRHLQKKYDDKMSVKANAGDGSQKAYKAAKRKLERQDLALDKAGKAAENAVKNTAKKTKEVAQNVAKKTKETAVKAKDATVEAGKKTGNFIKRAWEGETNGFSRDAAGRARKNGQFVSKKALKKNATKNRALMIGTPVVLAGTGIAAKKIAKNRKKSED